MYKLGCFVTMCLMCTVLFGQHRLQLEAVDVPTESLNGLLRYNNVYKSSDACKAVLPTLIKQLQQKGYAGASLDSVFVDSLLTRAVVYVGKYYELVQLRTKGIPTKVLAQVGYKTAHFEYQSLRFQQISALQEKLLVYYENRGFPFVKVGLEEVEIDVNGQVRATLYLEKERLITIDSLIITGKASINQRYLQQYLNVKKGMPYNENTIQQISKRLQELPFLQQIKTPVVTFIENRAQVHVFVKAKKASNFNLLVGLSPQRNVVPNMSNTRYQLTGDGQLHLQNALGAGEKIALDFKSYPNKITQFNSQALYPYLPLVPIGVELKFDLYIRDTLYRDVTTDIGFKYVFRGNDYFKVYYTIANSTLLSIDSSALAQSGNLPNVLDVKNRWYGISYNQEQLDYRFNPKKGWLLKASMRVGTRKVVENNAIIALDEQIGTTFKMQYDSLNLNNLQYQIELSLHKYWPVMRQTTLKTAVRGAFIGAAKQQNPLNNQLFRIGGNRILRGYDEESILSNLYIVSTLEYRYLLARNSHAFLFYDGAWVQALPATNTDAPANTTTGQWLNGFGAGINFETKAGVFGMSYALQKQTGTPIAWIRGKIHFGYITYF